MVGTVNMGADHQMFRHKEETGFLKAVHARTGEELWKFQTGSGINPSPITCDLDGEQHVAILSGPGGHPRLCFPAPKGGKPWVFAADGKIAAARAPTLGSSRRRCRSMASSSRSAAAALALALGGPAEAADEPSGRAKVRGPETLAIAGGVITLSGVEAPDAAARRATVGGEASREEVATAALEALAAAGPIVCTRERRLGHGYFLGRCRAADGTDPAERLLEQGLPRPEAGEQPLGYRAPIEAARPPTSGVWGW